MGRRVKEWEQGKIGEEKMAQSVESVIAYMRHFSPNVQIPLGGRDG